MIIPHACNLSLQGQQQPIIGYPICLQPLTARSTAVICWSSPLLATFHCKVNSNHSSVIPPDCNLSLQGQQQPSIGHPSCLQLITARSTAAINWSPSCLQPFTVMSTAAIIQSSLLFASSHCKDNGRHSPCIPPAYSLSLQGQQQPFIGHPSCLQPFTARSTAAIHRSSILFATSHCKINSSHSSVIPPVCNLSLQGQQQPFIGHPSCLQPFTAKSTAAIHRSSLLLATFHCKINSSHQSVIPPICNHSLQGS